MTDETTSTGSSSESDTGGSGTATEPTGTRAVYVISVAAELAGMHPQTLRIYERRGLVQPARTKGGNRRYSDDDIALLRRIADLAEAGMNLEGVRRVMVLEAEVERLRRELHVAREIAAHAIADRVRRQTGGELVPLKQTVAVYDERRATAPD
jgi:MerR family transcriptional regulator/heat shock protein HspR